MSSIMEVSGRAGADHARTAHIGAQLAAFRTIEPVRLPILQDLARAMDLVLATGRAQPPGTPRDGMCVKLPSGVGKTTSARILIAAVAEREGLPVEKCSVLHVELDVETTESLWSAILRSLGDPYYDVGYPKTLMKRAVKYLAKRGVQLIIIDEFNHCVERGQAQELMNTVKLILNKGIASVVCMGTDEELEKAPKLPAFERRMVSAPSIGPLDWGDDYHRLNWRGFLQGLDQAITGLDILPARSRLGAKALAEALCAACGGVIGYAHWIVQDALTEVLRRGGSSLEHDDLALSVNRHFVKHAIYDLENGVEAMP